MSEVRLIDANALKEAIIDRYGHWSRNYKSLWDVLDGVMCIIDNAPTVELDGYVLDGTGLELVSTDYLDEQLGKDNQD